MINKLYELLKKYKMSILIAMVILIIGLIILLIFLKVIGNDKLKSFENDVYSFKYDSSWKIKEKTDTNITLKHSNSGTLKIELIKLEDEYKYSEMSDLIDEIIYNIDSQNDDYKLISKKETELSKNNYNGYKLLYENKNNQVLIAVYKKSEQLIMFTYEASNDYFDILLDSVNNIIYNFDTVEKKYNLSYDFSIETSDITYDESSSVTSLLKDTTQYEIANNNYDVKYSIPSNFKESQLNTQYGYYNFDGLTDGSITISTTILNKNLYEFLNEEETLNIYSDTKSIKNNEDYSNFEDAISKLDDEEYEAYIYKYSYTYDKAVSYDKDFNKTYNSEIREGIILVYALNSNHTLEIKISSSKVSIPKELVEMIKIDSSKNYSSNIEIVKEDGNIIEKLKRFKDYNKDKIQQVTLKVPDKYKEIDNGYDNLYEKRKFVLDYNDDLELYDYEIEYELTSTSTQIDSRVKTISSSFSTAYGEHNDLTFTGKINVNDKSFSVYDGGYTSLSGIMFTNINRVKYYINKKVLFYEIENGGYLIITISGNGKDIPENIINDATNFVVEEI
jgi:hypothetical protein